MSKETNTTTGSKTGFRFLDLVERIGNKLPDPVTLFVIGAALVLVGSELAHQFEWEEKNPRYRADSEVQTESPTIESTSLLRGEGATWVWTNLVTNFTQFRPLGLVLVAMIGIGVAEHAGLISALLKSIISLTPQKLITPSLVFAGVMSSMALDAGYIVLPPLAAVIFARMGRSPLVGIAAVFAGVSAGFSGNLLITALDPMLQGITQAAVEAGGYDKYEVDVRCNYYFMVASTVLVTFLGWGVTAWIVEPRFDRSQIAAQVKAGAMAAEDVESKDSDSEALTDLEKKGLMFAALAVGGLTVFFLLMILIPGAPLHGTPEGTSVSRWVSAIVPMLLVFFIIPGIVYGIATRSVKRDRDIAAMMNKTMSMMGSYIILMFFAAQFTEFFNHSQLGTLIAIRGVEVLRQFNLQPWMLVLAIIFLTCVLNLFIGSASGKWALIAPVFVPMFMGLGISAELTQASYRVGDSFTNTIAPLNPYLLVVLVYIRRYLPEAGLGSLVSLMLPYTICFGVIWSAMLLIWMGIGMPLGPDGAPLVIDVP